MDELVLLLAVLIWIFVLPIFAASLALARGRSVLAWGGATLLLLGPVGVLMLLVLPPDLVAIEARLLATGERVSCSACQELVRPKATRCPHCSSALEG